MFKEQAKAKWGFNLIPIRFGAREGATPSKRRAALRVPQSVIICYIAKSYIEKEYAMKAFLAACIAAVALAAIGLAVLNHVQEPADQAFASPYARV